MGRFWSTGSARQPDPSPLSVREVSIDVADGVIVGVLSERDGRFRVQDLDGPIHEIIVDVAAVREFLGSAPITRFCGEPLALLNCEQRLLAIAYGPIDAPTHLAPLAALDLATTPISIPGSGRQPSYAIFRAAARQLVS